MIDTNQLSALVSAFRVETEKESISPETVGKLLQDILDLLKNASTDAERKVLDEWKAMLSQYTVVYDVSHATGMVDMEHMFLTLKGRSLRNGDTFSSSVVLYGANSLQAGVMTASHVQTLMALQTTLPQVRSAVTALQNTAQQQGWQLAAIQAAGFVVTDIRQGSGNATKILLSLTKHDVRTGEDFAGLGTCQIAAATASQAGAMTAAQVTALNTAKTDITALQSKMRIVQGAGTVVNAAQVFHIALDKVGIMLFGYDLATGEREIEHQSFYLAAASQYGAGVMTAQHVKQLDALRQAVFGGSGSSTELRPFYNFGIEIVEGKDLLYLRGVDELREKGYVPYLFRYSRKRNKTISPSGNKGHGEIRKGWNVVGKADTLSVGNMGLVKIATNVFEHEFETEGLEQYQREARFFLAEKTDPRGGQPYVPFGKTRIDLTLKQDDNSYKPRRVSLLYGIAFANYKVGKRDLLDKSRLVTPIVPFHIATCYNNKQRIWIFER